MIEDLEKKEIKFQGGYIKIKKVRCENGTTFYSSYIVLNVGDQCLSAVGTADLYSQAIIDAFVRLGFEAAKQSYCGDNNNKEEEVKQ